MLHDWPDDEARQILQNQIPAMSRGFSKLLIHEVIMPAQDPSPECAAVDMIMLSMAAATERTESMWRKLLSSVGLRIEQIWRKEGYEETVMEIDIV